MRNLAHKTLAAVVVAITLCTGLFVSGFGVSTAQAQPVFNASLDPKRPVIDKSGALDNLASGLKNELTQQLARANSLHAKGASSGKEYSIFMVVVNGTDSLTPQQWGKEFLSHNHAPTPSVVLVIDSSQQRGGIASNDQAFLTDKGADLLYVQNNTDIRNSPNPELAIRFHVGEGYYGSAGRQFASLLWNFQGLQNDSEIPDSVTAEANDFTNGNNTVQVLIIVLIVIAAVVMIAVVITVIFLLRRQKKHDFLLSQPHTEKMPHGIPPASASDPHQNSET